MNQPELRDIHLPDGSLWWPPAAGWWFVLLLILLLLWLLPRLLRWLRYKPPKRLSLQELERIRRSYKAGQSDGAVLREVAALLRRVTISYYGREQYAAFTGNQWIEQLQRLAPGSGFSDQQLQLLAHDRYRAQCELDVDALLRSLEQWLRALPRSNEHVSA
ncbi:MAG: DUF4381 domain-containing protein [Gammaproteobacteria bacterium]|jgi:hypothetical protein|nr:DUF4381 domain-containing protein [Gammaproteobacteria bacterium]